MLNFDLLPLPNVGGLTRSDTVGCRSTARHYRFNECRKSGVPYPIRPKSTIWRVKSSRTWQSPDIIALQEIQDNNGTTDDGTVDASETYGALIAAIQTAGGPVYEYRDIAPLDGLDGGVPGGNIRVGFLFNPARVTFIDRPGGDATTATSSRFGRYRRRVDV